MTRRNFISGTLFLATTPKLENLRTMEKRLFDTVNNQRGHIGVADLVWSDDIAAAARAQSAGMMERGFFSHDDPVRGNLAARLDAAEIHWLRCGENLFTEWGFIEPVWTAIVEWMHSPGHKETLLDPAYTHAGVGIVRNAEEKYWMSQIFTQPPLEPVRQRPIWNRKKRITRKAR